MTKLTARVASFDEFKRMTQDRGGFVEAPWCGSTECEDKIKEDTGATIRAVPFTENPTDKGCVYCGRPSRTLVHFARAY